MTSETASTLVSAHSRSNSTASMDEDLDPSRQGNPGLSQVGWSSYASSTSFLINKRSVFMPLWVFLDIPASSLAARAWSTILSLIITLSCVSFVTQSLPQYYFSTNLAFDTIEVTCIVIFTVEYTLRWITCPYDGMEFSWSEYLRSRAKFMVKAMNVVDLVAILPYYIELVVNSILGSSSSNTSILVVARVVRITRIFRLFKLGKNYDGIEILFLTLRKSGVFLFTVVFLILLFQVLFGSLLFFFEGGSNCVIAYACTGGADSGVDCTILELPDGSVMDIPAQQARMSYCMHPWVNDTALCSNDGLVANNSKAGQCQQGSTCVDVGNVCFSGSEMLSALPVGSKVKLNSIPMCMWWALVTMCCVGFGDVVPETSYGKVLGCIAALTGLVVLAMPTTVLGGTFSDIYEEYYRRKNEKETESENENEDIPKGLKGTNSKHLNRMIVAKQLAQKKGPKIPQELIANIIEDNPVTSQEKIFQAFKELDIAVARKVLWSEFRAELREKSRSKLQEVMEEMEQT
ncbi:hypothetical protein GUITHDRAFT_152622 [Guillardia theta CCMP2712]|uniref:Ion transport domain-containing protein n=2 Tax=Guillardia theta TaxID=55529 RepID=L1JB30_GUITC|nr:hypothetical protein GUITHDRAFT_152622 [Guillardia theta CCMP2712]EKX45532.1 hypothetical protein GUITHDRAFT_152622 [Guillardia theta CCMP2712]|mmetsp:Transcript_31215/g.100157  ORF Transcript_31215/g.100157 Transcript_31215/m.100157 type:complete len:518 (+) Transcript_31215:459-2012(+)|eukprot:XP_005832512.1 hypothetical protein GUITHDRAFT_152622 [Guillardia theta CCMP2712]